MRRGGPIPCVAAIAAGSASIAGAAADPATTGGAAAVRETSAMLNGAVSLNNADTAHAFQYGTTTHYGHTTPTVPVAKSMVLGQWRASGLAAPGHGEPDHVVQAAGHPLEIP